MTNHEHDTSKRRTLVGLTGLALGASAAIWSNIAQSQTKVVRFILPVATASGVDTITRASSQALSTALGASVVVENQPGAGGGIVGTSAMIKSPPDGTTLSIVSNNHVIYPSVSSRCRLTRSTTSRRSR